VAEVSAFLGTTPDRLLKSLLFISGEDDPILAVVPGDRELNEAKLVRHLGTPLVRLATEAEIERHTGGPLGFTGPAGLPRAIRTVYDRTVEEGRNYVTGGNRKDIHRVGVRVGRDLAVSERADLVTAREGDRCPRCGAPMRVGRGIEVGHVFKLGAKYSGPMRARFLDAEGAERTMIMGCYGIGITRMVAAVIEQRHDGNGIQWPWSVAPYHVHIVPVNWKDEPTRSAAESIYAGLAAAGVETLLDDRDERPGSKFKDADLLGMPLRVTVGEKGLREGIVELRDRGTGTVDRVPLGDAVESCRKRVSEGLRSLS
jgi:prolyl-tRNA synthetase